jgi:hypothetical protein
MKTEYCNLEATGCVPKAAVLGYGPPLRIRIVVLGCGTFARTWGGFG